MKKLAIITTHPIQYNAPLFRLLSKRGIINIKIFYTWSQTESGTKYDPGFNQNISWDIPLLDGYPYVFSRNISASPGSHHHKGIDNPSLITEIENWNADAVMLYGWNFKSHFKAMRYFHGRIPVLFRGDSTLLNEQPGLKKILRRLFLRYVFSFADIALYAGSSNKDYFKVHGIKDPELIFMPHAVDNIRFERNNKTMEDAAQLRHEMNIPADAVVFLFAGKLEENKQPEMLINVFTEIKRANTYLIIAGSGKLEDHLRIGATENKHIIFAGFQNQEQMPVLYASCDVFILPSQAETWGLAVNEAMAAGKAILITDTCGAAADLVSNGSNGYIFGRNDLTTLKQHLLFFSENKAAAAEMGLKSQKRIKNYNLLQDAIAVEDATLSATENRR